MKKDKYLEFLIKLLTGTKDGRIKWQRSLKRQGNLVDIFAGVSLVPSKCFYADLETMVVFLDYYSDDSVFLCISYDINLAEVQFYSDDSEAVAMVKRIHNYVYNQFPNAEKIIDSFLESF